jgi:hypothetical protein
MIDDSRKKFEKENVLSISFLEEDGTLIANSIQSCMLSRLSSFQISLNGGDRIYNCLNTRYLGDLKLEKEVVTPHKKIDFEKIEKLMFKDLLSFQTCLNLEKSWKKSNTSGEIISNITYSTILKDYLNVKFSPLKDFHHDQIHKRERHIQKLLNAFFSCCLLQTITLNLCTFVFFSWDFMEPITQCITFLNIIVGYYYWAITNNDYEIESMLLWMRSRRLLFQPALSDYMMKEMEQIEKMLKDSEENNY